MGWDFFFKLSGVAFGMLFVLWLPVLWGYIYAKRRLFERPRQFAFFSGCTSYGIYSLIGALVAIPMGLILVKIAPQECLGLLRNGFCLLASFVDKWAVELGWGASVVITFLSPFIFNKYVWSRLERRQQVMQGGRADARRFAQR